MKQPNIALKQWMGKGELAKLARALGRYWQSVQQALSLPLAQQDIASAPLPMVALLAWQRHISRLDQEPEQLFRLRVANAYRFTRHGGETDGFQQMFATLGISWLTIHERQPEQPWDVVTLETSDSDLSENTYLMNAMIRHYGRTCRRYRFSVSYPTTLHLHPGRFSHRFDLYRANNFDSVKMSHQHTHTSHQQQRFIARFPLQ